MFVGVTYSFGMYKCVVNISKGEEHKQILEELIDNFTKHKLSYYKDDKRFMADFQIDRDCKPFNLQVAAVPFENAVPQACGKSL